MQRQRVAPNPLNFFQGRLTPHDWDHRAGTLRQTVYKFAETLPLQVVFQGPRVKTLDLPKHL